MSMKKYERWTKRYRQQLEYDSFSISELFLATKLMIREWMSFFMNSDLGLCKTVFPWRKITREYFLMFKIIKITLWFLCDRNQDLTFQKKIPFFWPDSDFGQFSQKTFRFIRYFKFWHLISFISWNLKFNQIHVKKQNCWSQK